MGGAFAPALAGTHDATHAAPAPRSLGRVAELVAARSLDVERVDLDDEHRDPWRVTPDPTRAAPGRHRISGRMRMGRFAHILCSPLTERRFSIA